MFCMLLLGDNVLMVAGRCGGVWRSTWQKRGTLSDLLAVSCPTTRSFQHVRHSNCCVSRGDHRCPRLALQSRSTPQMVRLPNYCYVPPLFIPLEDRKSTRQSICPSNDARQVW